MRYNKLVPELSVTNLERSLQFYKMLGFKTEYDRPEKRFAFLSLEGSQLMLDEGVDDPESRFYVGEAKYPLGRGLHFQIEVKSLDKIMDLLKKNNYPLKCEVQEDWFRNGDEMLGMRNILVQDPDGYLLMFHQDIGSKPVEADGNA
jgi:catechol 2,3-dioxygenase-like lactoylglutathione lyase family enzyme